MHTVTYASRRAEIWRWYWRAWPQPTGLWRFHVLFALTVATVSTGVHTHNGIDWGYFLVALIFGFLSALILLPLWPQIRFKGPVRSLTIDPNGLRTTIGEISASRLWKEVRSIELRDSGVIISGFNKNAFIIPSRAFANDGDRVIFYEDALRWHADALA